MKSSYTGRAVEVIVVTFNSERVVEELLDSLDAGLEGVDWRVQVIDNGSTDQTLEHVRAHAPGVSVVAIGGNTGYGAAINRGIGTASPGSDVLVLNADVRLKSGAAERLQARLREPASPRGRREGGSQSWIGIAAPRTVNAAGMLEPTLRREPSIIRALAEALLGARRAGRLGWGEAVLDRALYDRATVADWASGAALMISRECLDACGGWDESFFLYSEDTEYALRARDRGFLTTLVPEAEVTHLGGDSRSDRRLWTLLVTNKLRLYRSRHGRGRALAFRLAALVRELRFAATGNRPSRAAARALLTPPKGAWR